MAYRFPAYMRTFLFPTGRCPFQVATLTTRKPTEVRTAKKTLGPYALYVSENMKSLRASNAGALPKDLMKVLGQQWASLAPEEKEEYKVKAEAKQREYDDEYENLSDLERDELTAQRQARLHKRRALGLKKEKVETGKPKQPKSAFHYFLISQSKASLVIGSEEWNKAKEEFQSLPSHQLQIYREQQDEDSVRYHQEMVKWVAKVTQEGRDHLVSRYAKNKYCKTDE